MLRDRLAVSAALLMGLGVLFRAHAVAYDPLGLPTWDSAGYLLEGVKLYEKLSGGDFEGFFGLLIRPDLHPPLHALLLSLWLGVFGNSLEVARAYPVFAYVLAMGCTVAVGWLVGGLRAGVLAAAGFALGLTSLDLLCTPMTESSAVWTQLLALGLAIHAQSRPVRAAWVGWAVLAAGMVRYNLWPMLLAPLFAEHLWHHLRQRDWRGAVNLRVLWWVAPTLGTLLLWQLVRPDLARNIQKFLQNRSSGIDFWSAENLLWVPVQMGSAFVHPVVAGLVLLGFFVGVLRAALRPESGERGLNLLQLFVLASFVALTLHDFKVVRNLHAVLPVLYVCAAVEWLRWVPAWGLGAGVVLWAGWAQAVVVPQLPARSDFKADPVVRRSLEFIAGHARDSERTWVVGWVFRISPNVIDWYLRSEGIRTKLKLDQPLFGAETRMGIDPSWNAQYPEWVESALLVPDVMANTTYVTIQTAPGTRYADDWKAFGNNYARAFAEQSTDPEIDRLAYIDQGLLVRAYRAGGSPSVATLNSQPRPPDAADNADVRIPPGEPLWRDTMHGLAPAWRVYPAKAGERVQVERVASVLRLTMAEPVADLQLCSDLQPKPSVSPLRLVVNVGTTALRGKAWLHVRGMGDDDKLVQKAEGGPDIAQAGPLAADGEQLFERNLTLDAAATQLRVCIVLGEASGMVALNDVAIYGPDTPWVRSQAVAEVPQGGLVAAEIYPGDEVGVTLPAGGVRFRETFNREQTGWRKVPGNAPMTVRRDGSATVLGVAAPQAPLQYCGPTFPAERGTAVVHLRGRNVTGRGAFFHWRGLDKDGVLVKAGAKPAIQMAGPLKDGVLRSEIEVLFPEDVTQVRPCVVLDDLSGEIWLEDLAVIAR